ncbi:nicotinate phosphoribosyltransferase family protein [Striga asiatica]|uniref:nicotinate phosphoribosyltransferase n=1 Tax=Striga asiatica TaxID=4170 RepID=A0A5A7R1W2_STRAF|nr:nicotinate phosphoribosyltransferase family protein [Striga asiatica]
MDKNIQMAPSSVANGTKKLEKLAAGGVDRPTNPMVTPLLTDLYQFTMAYAYWKAGKHNDLAVFDLYFRRNPFGGEYTVFAGLEECIKLIANFRFTEDEIAFIKSSLPSSCEDGFYDYLRAVDCSSVEIHAISEGYVVFPKIPLMRIEGPVAVVQLLETPLVNLINYASLVATNAARHRFVVGKSKLLLEFGLRRAQGPDGGISASKYCYMGGFDATSNCAAGKLFGIPLRGTHSHAFVSSFTSPDEIAEKSLKSCDSSMTCEDFVSLVRMWLSRLKRSAVLGGIFSETNQSELAAFVSYALAFPNNFLALVDTYDVMRSGVPNFCAVALALNDLGYKAAGVRLDSGDLAYLSCETRRFFQAIEKEFRLPGFGKTSITASNDLNEVTLDALKKQGHEIDVFGIGTHLVTCYAQPALGVVFKLVEINNQPRIKLSEDVSKVSIPCKKRCYRLYGKEGYSLVDLMTGENEPPPKKTDLTSRDEYCSDLPSPSSGAIAIPKSPSTEGPPHVTHVSVQFRRGGRPRRPSPMSAGCCYEKGYRRADASLFPSVPLAAVAARVGYYRQTMVGLGGKLRWHLDPPFNFNIYKSAPASSASGDGLSDTDAAAGGVVGGGMAGVWWLKVLKVIGG